MLTPQEIQQANQVTGWNVPTTHGTPNTPSLSEQYRQRAQRAEFNSKPHLGQGGAGEFAGNAVRAVVSPLIRTGAIAEEGLDKVFGTHTAEGAKKTADFLDSSASQSVAGKAGTVTGVVAPYLTGVGEEEMGAQLATHIPALAEKFGMTTEQFIPKLTSYLAKNTPTAAKDFLTGTVQTQNPGEGALTALGGQVARPVLEGAGKLIAPKGTEAAAASETKKVSDTIRPILTKGEIQQATGVAGREGKTVEQHVDEQLTRPTTAIINVAKALGKKPTEIVKPGLKTASKNAANLGTTIQDYSKNVVSPFLKKSRVNYNFNDLRKALQIAKPGEALEPDSLPAYNKVRERILGAIADRISPETKSISSLTSLRNATKESGSVPQKILKGDEDFWDARKIIDNIVDEETRGKAWGDASLRGAQAAYKDFRKAFAQYLEDGFRYPGQMDKVNKANDFLSTSQMKGIDKSGWNLEEVEKQFGLRRSPLSDINAEEWKSYMSNLSGVYDAIANLATQEPKQFGKSWLSLFARNHPNLYKAGAIGLAGLGIGTLGTLGVQGVVHAATGGNE